MSGSLSPLFSRLLALSLLVALCAGIFLFGVVPLRQTHRDLDAGIAQAEEQLQRLNQVAARAAPLMAQLQRAETVDANRRDIFSGENINLLGAAVQADLKESAAQAGGDLKSFQVLDSEPTGSFRRFAVRAIVDGDMRAIQHVLHDVESRRPFLIVERLNIQTRRAPRRRASESDENLILLSAHFDLVGFMREETP